MTSSTIVATPTYTKVMLKARPARGWQDQNGDVFGGQVREAQIKTSAWTTAPDAGKIPTVFWENWSKLSPNRQICGRLPI
jgi:hypothetical protein